MGIFDGLLYERPEEIRSILMDPYADRETRRLAKTVDTQLKKTVGAGYEPEEVTPRKNLFLEGLDFLDSLRQGNVGILDALLRGDIFTPEVGLGYERGKKEDVTVSDLLRRHDVIDNPILRGIAGFAGDVLLDPLTYPSFGLSSLGRKIGGRTLTEAGSKVVGDVTRAVTSRTKGLGDPGLMLGADQFIEDGKIVDQVFRRAAHMQQYSKEVKKAIPGSKAHAEAQKLYMDAQSFIESHGLKAGTVLDELNPLFEKPALHFGVNVPFLGHLAGKTAKEGVQERVKIPGFRGMFFEAMGLAGKVFKPGRLEHVQQLPPGMVEVIEDIGVKADRLFAPIESFLASLEKAPVIGKGIGAVNSVRKGFATAFNNAFRRAGVVGPDINNLLRELEWRRGGAKASGQDAVLQVLTDTGLKNPQLGSQAAELIDGAATEALHAIELDPASMEKFLDSSQQMQRNLAAGRDMTGRKWASDLRDADGNIIPSPLEDVQGAWTGARAKLLTETINGPNVAPEVADIVRRFIGKMDEIGAQENFMGVKHGLLETYLMHRYLNPNRNPYSRHGAAHGVDFTQPQKWKSLDEAFAKGGKVGNTDLASLIELRVRESELRIADKEFFNRLVIEHGLPLQTVQALYREAASEPGGAAYEMLKRRKYKVTPGEDAELYLRGKGQQDLGEALRATKATNSPEYEKLVKMTEAELSDFAHKRHLVDGLIPKDANVPHGLWGEIGTVVKHEGEEFVLPHAIASAFNDVRTSRDIIKNLAGTTSFGKAMLKGADRGLRFFKTITLLPFPAYWAQNLLGDRFRNIAAGIHTINPGLPDRVHQLLTGKASITNEYGQVLTKDTLDKLAKQVGLHLSPSDYLGYLDSFGEGDINRFMARNKSSAAKNLSGLAKGNWTEFTAGLSQIHDKLNYGFDGFFRLNQIVHRFEQGDGMMDAVRSANNLYFDYRDLSAAEKSVFRRLYMFYGYTSKATKAAVTDLITQPGNLTSQLHGVRALAELFSNPDAAPTAEEIDLELLSSHATHEQLSRVLGKSPEGKTIFGRGFAAPINAMMQQFDLQVPRNLSVGELLSWSGDMAKRNLQKQFATANPVIKTVGEGLAEKNLYFNKPLDAEFLRKIPSLNSLAERLLGLSYDDLPGDLDAASKKFLNAVPDGKGRLIADPGMFWILNNIIPGLGRLTSMAGALANEDIPMKMAWMRSLLNVNLSGTELSQTYLYSQKEALEKFMRARSIEQQVRNQKEGIE